MAQFVCWGAQKGGNVSMVYSGDIAGTNAKEMGSMESKGKGYIAVAVKLVAGCKKNRKESSPRRLRERGYLGPRQ
eukprot:scaffold276556_cov14-Tisochrysis_lutea.AAC.1